MLHTDLLPNHQGIYTPLSQAMTDSESDEEIEIHNANKHRLQHQLHQQQLQLQQQQSQQQQQRNRIRIPPNTLALKSPHTQSKQQQHQQRQQQQQQQQFNNSNCSSYTTNMQNTFRSVMLSDLGSNAASNVGVEFSNFGAEYETNADNVAILGHQSDQSEFKRSPMSTKRRCCFIASLLLCLFAVVGFVWIVPCGPADGTGVCPAPVDRQKTRNWFKNYTKIELRGGVNVVAGLRAWENNLIFLYRGDVFFPDSRPNNHKRNGIISLIGSSGDVAWYDETVDEPVAIDCTLLDVDLNGKPDCLVIEEYGEVGAINSGSGEWHWRFKDHAAQKLNAHDFPLILPDIDGDGVLDILLISSLSLEQRTKTLIQQQQPKQTQQQLEARNVLRLLSGRRGRPIGEGFRIHDCQKLSRLQLNVNNNISYSCTSSTDQPPQQRFKSLAELYALITNKSLMGRRLMPASKIAQHRKQMDTQRNVYLLSGRELILENRGKCPDCNVTLQLSEMRDGRRHMLYNQTETAMYGMAPAQWHFKNSKSKVSGFVIKFWKWISEVKAKSPPASNSNNVDKMNNYTNSSSSTSAKNLNSIKEKDKNKDKIYSKNQQQQQQQQHQQQQQQKKQQQQQQQRLKRDSLTHQFPAEHEEFDLFHPIQKRETFRNQSKSVAGLMKNYKMQMITETVILVLFIGADTRIVNTSQSNIIQFCRSDRNEMICQPDLLNQENSMLIADLDTDGSQELVSYMSTFVKPSEYPYTDYKLISYVRLLRIQSELPAYYEQEKLN
ncbi:uncharacterized protein LOC108658737 isoform X2 [Drosophila navojoa]|uniref:uncharacterized protein LOC108658737 isoform X2 n=1 Tax=Drosophila navojoa TaxID=7232 RepID=UPI0011BD5E6D|nr:uncharacterized protein LOC108658737 isoform X2 [Drosophila navojoa]